MTGSGSSFPCSVCGAGTRVIDSRATHGGVRRRRICLTAEAHRFTTYEQARADVEMPAVEDGDLREVRVLMNRIVRRAASRPPKAQS